MIGISSNIILYLKFYNILFKNNIGLKGYETIGLSQYTAGTKGFRVDGKIRIKAAIEFSTVGSF